MDSKMNSTEFSSISLQNATSSDISRFCPIKPQHISIPVLICLTFLVGLLLNVFSLWVFTCRTPVWKSSTVLQFHLAVSDVIICPAGPFMAIYYRSANWIFGKALCRLKVALIFFHIYSSILFLSLISVHRYVAVVRYNRDSCMNRKDFVQKLCVGVWLFILIMGTAFAATVDTSTVNDHTLCLSIHQRQYIDFYFIVNFTILIPVLFLAFIVSVVCYCLLVRSMSLLDTSHNNGQAIKAKSHKMVAVCLVTFVAYFMPMNVVRSVGIVVKKFFPHECSLLLEMETAYYVSWIVAGANCCLDPIIYCFSSKKFMRNVHISLSKIGVRCETGHDED